MVPLCPEATLIPLSVVAMEIGFAFRVLPMITKKTEGGGGIWKHQSQALGYNIGARLNRRSRVYSAGPLDITVDHIQQLGKDFIQIKSSDREVCVCVYV